MIYAKNVPNWERILRIVMGATALLFALMNWRTSSWAVCAGMIGAVFAMTGLIGFCPMCSMAGRKLDKEA